MDHNKFDYNRAFSRNIGWVTPEEQKILSKKCVAIAGMGGVGGSHLLTLARLGIGSFHLADFDTFEIENFNRQAGAKISSLNSPKLEILVEMALDINPNLKITRFNDGLTPENIDDFLKNTDIFIDGLDFFCIKIRSLTFERANQLNIPAITAAPLGMGVSNLNFIPGGMTFEEYFRLNGKDEEEQYIRFLIGLSPNRLQSSYLVYPDAVKISEKKGPSTIMACNLCSGIIATQALKLLLNRGKVLSAPHCLQFDAYTNQFKITWRPFGNLNPINRLSIFIGKKIFLKSKQLPYLKD